MGFWRGFAGHFGPDRWRAVLRRRRAPITKATSSSTQSEPPAASDFPEGHRRAAARSGERARPLHEPDADPLRRRGRSSAAISAPSRAVERARNGWCGRGPPPIQLRPGSSTGGDVQSDAIEPICARRTIPQCGPSGARRSRQASRHRQPDQTSDAIRRITNNQMRNVEEGDIVKQIDQYLLVLQDGRIFVVDTRGGGRRLALADRVERLSRCRNRTCGMTRCWCSATGSSSPAIPMTRRRPSSSVFRLDRAGRLAREGVFRHLVQRLLQRQQLCDPADRRQSSSSTRRSASRTWRRPRFRLADRPPLAARRGRRRGSAREAAGPAPVRRRFDLPAGRATLVNPIVHTVSVCPLGAAGSARLSNAAPPPSSAPAAAQWYVTGRPGPSCGRRLGR